MSKTKLQILTAIIISLSTVSIALANAPVNVAFKALSQKLKTDLAVSSVNLTLDKVQSQNISRTEVRITGVGAANDLPINFDVRVNKIKDIPTDVDYVFVDAPSTAAADTEDVLTRGLLSKLNKDYKTQDIVISIDGFDTTQDNGAKNLKGTGEMRVGLEWSKIDFDVTLDTKTNTATAIKYQVKN